MSLADAIVFVVGMAAVVAALLLLALVTIRPDD